MKKIFTLLFMFAISFICKTSFAQLNQPYWTENFDDANAGQLTGTTASAPTTPTTYTLTSGPWTFYYAFRSGAGCQNDAVPVSAKAIRILQTTVATPAGIVPPAYMITPTVNAGIGTITWDNAKSTVPPATPSNTGIYKSQNGGATWILVAEVPTTTIACDGYTLAINDPLANKIRFTNDNVSAQIDIDHVTLNSFANILPIVFSGNKAYQKNTGVQIDWSINNDNNASSYVIERSSDGTSFSSIGNVNAQSSSTATINYSWYDAAPLNGNNFYRIKAVDRDGSIKFTSVMKVTISGGKPSISILPNPVKGNVVNLQLVNVSKGNYTVNVYNISGQNVFTSQVKSEGGSSSQTLQLPAAIKAGTYNLQLSNGADVRLNKTIVIE